MPSFLPSLGGDTTNGAATHAEETHDVHWTYSGDTGPAQWGDLSEEYKLCNTGQEQSPINLTSAVGKNISDITFNYHPSDLKIHNNGHTIQVEYDPGSSIIVDGVTYELKQFHFHSQSEHTVDRAHYPLELHLVHRTPEGKRAVVGVLIEAGTENAAFASTLAHAPSQKSEVTTITGVEINALDMLPTEGNYYGYDGSLTTPPCDQEIKWHVLSTPVQMSQAQLDGMAKLLHNNFRPIQELHNRALTLDTESAAVK